MDAVKSAGLAVDAKALESLKHQAKASPQQATRQAAQQFEAMFMNMLLKSMREALPNSDPLASSAGKTFTGMLDSELAQKMAAGKGLGLADVMVRQLERKPAATPSAASSSTLKPLQQFVAPAPTPAASGPVAPTNTTQSQKDFVSRMLAPARAAAKESGIPEHFMLGQAALESGWGRREIRSADGTTSHNLFGIKAGRNWTGPTVETLTTEFVNGTPRKVVEKFRAYASYADSFRDYAKLIGNTPRYAEAARSGGDANVFANRVQAAGYATDPNYAGKLARVIQQSRQIQTTV
jgi:flagellar protein FlgJ